MGSFTQGNDTYACSSSGCQITCASPEFGANVCYSMQQNFLDGTSCQGGGKCNNGACDGASVGKEITGWITSHKPLVIGLSAAIGGFLILAILSCCWSRYRKRNQMKRNIVSRPPPGWAGRAPGFNVPPNMQRAQRNNMPPPPGGSGGYWENGRWQPTSVPAPVWTPGPSVRYA
jgi:hypothetical protein